MRERYAAIAQRRAIIDRRALADRIAALGGDELALRNREIDGVDSEMSAATAALKRLGDARDGDHARP